MIRTGTMCAHCRGGRCSELPTPSTPIILETVACPDCRGKGGTCCEVNGPGSGKRHLRRCPQEEIGEAVAELCRRADLADKGLWPEDGGYNSQPGTFLQAYRALKAAEAECNADQAEQQRRKVNP